MSEEFVIGIVSDGDRMRCGIFKFSNKAFGWVLCVDVVVFLQGLVIGGGRKILRLSSAMGVELLRTIRVCFRAAVG